MNQRMRGYLAKANKRLTLQVAAFLLAGSTLLSTALGFLRERFLNGDYYKTYPEALDAYTVAFIIPDFMFILLVSGALSVTFIPVFNERLIKGNKKSAWQLSSSMINLFALLTLIASVAMMIFAEPLIRYVVAPGLDETSRGLAVSMMRVIAISPFLFAIASVVASMQQAIGRFTFFALAPTIYNIGIIIGILVFTEGIPFLGFEGGIMGVALGVVLGAILQLIVSCIGLVGLGFDYEFKIHWQNKGFRKVLSLLPARSFDQGIDYFNSIVETNLASRLMSGSIRAYQQATTLHMMPINLIGVAISTAAYPKMTERIAQGRSDLFKKELQSVLRVIIWLIVPTALIVFFTRGYLVNFIIEGGDNKIAQTFGVLVIAIIFRSIYHIAARAFYAQQDTKTPLYISIFAIALNIGLAAFFVLQAGFDVYGLALAQSIVSVVEVSILFVIMSRRIKGLFDVPFVHAVSRMIAVAGLMGLVCYAAVKVFDLSATDEGLIQTLPKFIMICGISVSSYLLFSRLFNVEEVEPVLRRISRIVFRQYKPATVGDRGQNK